MDEIDNIIFELFLLIRKVSSDWGYMFNYWVNIHPPSHKSGESCTRLFPSYWVYRLCYVLIHLSSLNFIDYLVKTKPKWNAENTLNFFCFYVRYESHYALPLGRKKGAKLSEADEKILSQKRSSKTDKKYKERQKDAKVDQALNDQFLTGMQNICL